MIKDVTIKLGGTKQAKRQYESIRADIEVTFTIPPETSLNLEQTMEAYQYELRCAKVMFREAMIAASHEIDGKPPAPKIEVKEPPRKEKKENVDEDKLFEMLKDQVRRDYLNKQEAD
tara:strand:- start:211 stop:561 length:351 start_codon:yes stop_codon:yes gene_type:complete